MYFLDSNNQYHFQSLRLSQILSAARNANAMIVEVGLTPAPVVNELPLNYKINQQCILIVELMK